MNTGNPEQRFISVKERRGAKNYGWFLTLLPGKITITGGIGINVSVRYDATDKPVYKETVEKANTSNGTTVHGFLRCGLFVLESVTEMGDDPEPGSGPKTGEIKLETAGSVISVEVPYDIAAELHKIGREVFTKQRAGYTRKNRYIK